VSSGATPTRVTSLDGSVNNQPGTSVTVGSEPVLIEFGRPIAAPGNFRKVES
jgi:hypothetical protein